MEFRICSKARPAANMAKVEAKGTSPMAAVPAAAAAGSICNTVLYLGLMLLFYTLLGLESTGLLALIGGTGLIAGGCEAAAAALISTPIAAAPAKNCHSDTVNESHTNAPAMTPTAPPMHSRADGGAGTHRSSQSSTPKENRPPSKTRSPPTGTLWPQSVMLSGAEAPGSNQRFS